MIKADNRLIDRLTGNWLSNRWSEIDDSRVIVDEKRLFFNNRNRVVQRVNAAIAAATIAVNQHRWGDEHKFDWPCWHWNHGGVNLVPKQRLKAIKFQENSAVCPFNGRSLSLSFGSKVDFVAKCAAQRAPPLGFKIGCSPQPNRAFWLARTFGLWPSKNEVRCYEIRTHTHTHFKVTNFFGKCQFCFFCPNFGRRLVWDRMSLPFPPPVHVCVTVTHTHSEHIF